MKEELTDSEIAELSSMLSEGVLPSLSARLSPSSQFAESIRNEISMFAFDFSANNIYVNVGDTSVLVSRVSDFRTVKEKNQSHPDW